MTNFWIISQYHAWKKSRYFASYSINKSLTVCMCLCHFTINSQFNLTKKWTDCLISIKLTFERFFFSPNNHIDLLPNIFDSIRHVQFVFAQIHSSNRWDQKIWRKKKLHSEITFNEPKSFVCKQEQEKTEPNEIQFRNAIHSSTQRFSKKMQSK